ncbi:MAG: ribonuclease HII [Candidatus Aenigmatarchaeota archaeon]
MIGPMVIAGVAINKKDEKKLVKIGVRDSKELSEEKREELAEKIEKIAKDILVLRVQPCKIDTLRAKGINLDKIEAMKMAEIIEMIDVDKIYVDSLEQNSTRFKDLIKSFLKTKLNVELIVENYLDESVPVVSAASIIAKVERDKVIEELKRKINYDFGVGYPHDERTIEFLKKIIKESKGKELPAYIRKSWITTQFLQKDSWQKKLKDFFNKKF